MAWMIFPAWIFLGVGGGDGGEERDLALHRRRRGRRRPASAS